MTRVKMHIYNVKLPFYSPCEVKYRLQNRVSTSSGPAPLPPPPPSGDPTSKEYVDPTAVVDPPPSTSGDSSIRSMLDTVMIVQVAYGKLLVDVLTELQALCSDLASIRQSPPPPLFDDES